MISSLTVFKDMDVLSEPTADMDLTTEENRDEEVVRKRGSI